MTDERKSEIVRVERKPGKTEYKITTEKKKGGTQDWFVQPDKVSPKVTAMSDEELAAVQVVFDMPAGKWPDRLRLPGDEWDGPERATRQVRHVATRNTKKYENDPLKGSRRSGTPPQLVGEFHNPYNFIPALSRQNVSPNSCLSDRNPITSGKDAHHKYHDDGYSGSLRISVTTKTPLLIPDTSTVEIGEADHKTYNIRVDANGAPLLPITSIKGALRSAYEAVTNSRLSVFKGHDQPAAFRMGIHDAINLIPARVVVEGEKTSIELMNNGQDMDDSGKPRHGLMYAAWLDRYRKYRPRDTHVPDKHERQQALRYPDKSLPAHGDEVWIQTKEENHRSGRFSYLRVQKIRRADTGDAKPNDLTGQVYRGFVCITGRNSMNKHYERVFIESDNDPELKLNKHHLEAWKTLLNDYKAIHKEDIRQREKENKRIEDYHGHQPGDTGFSTTVFARSTVELQHGDLVFARLRNASNPKRTEVDSLYPVMASRDLYKRSAEGLLRSQAGEAADEESSDETNTMNGLTPAKRLDQLSPADRVFGWVGQNGGGAWKGKLRIGRVKFEDGESAIARIKGRALPLMILGAPRASLPTFYTRDKNGAPLAVSKSDGFQEGDLLAGRKVYPHHKHLEESSADDYWNTDSQSVAQANSHKINGSQYYEEYRRLAQKEPKNKEKDKDSQNRSIKAWVKPGSTFSVDIEVTNLTTVELGALLWLLSPENGCLRIGGGKPLGFGSALPEIVATDLKSGAEMRDYYMNLAAPIVDPSEFVTVQSDLIESAINKYKKEVAVAYDESKFENIEFIKAYTVSAKGFDDDLPIHYPRRTAYPQPEGKNFEWFTEAQRPKNPSIALPTLSKESGLPLQSDSPRKQQTRN